MNNIKLHVARLSLAVSVLWFPTAALAEADYNAALSAANQAKESALKAKNLWGGTAKMITQAKASAKKGKYLDAVSKLKEARRQAEVAVEQMALEADRWKDNVLQ